MTTLAELTPRQIAVASLVAKSWTNKQIALELGITDHRVRVLISAAAYRCAFEPNRDERVQLAEWFRKQCPISVEHAA